MKKNIRMLCMLSLGLLSVGSAQARHQATIVLNNGGQAQGVVRYLPASRSFEISNGPATRRVTASEVAQIVLAQEPAQLQPALQAVERGRYQQAIPVLSEIVESYTMFGPDIPAGRALMVAYLRTNRSSEAMKAGEDLLKINPDMIKDARFARAYWEALMEEERMSTLRESMQTAVETGGREVAAVALLRRGDLEMREDRAREALVDGYLRVILMFRDVQFLQAEALYKAIQAHEALREMGHAEKWRKELLSRYGSSEFANMLN